MEVGEDFPHLPPGFRFHPSDEELIVHYLFNKVKLRSLPAKVISEIELYKFDPWDLPSKINSCKALFGKDEWYFFTPRDRKYPNGSRPNRAAGSGFWKAMGKDKSIFASSRKIGVKKALSFFTGNMTKNKKTNWIMSEYRLPDPSNPSKQNGSMRLDDWVLCRIRQKGNNSNNTSIDENPKNKLIDVQIPTLPELPSSYMSSYMTTKASSHITSWFKDFQLTAAILAGHELPMVLEACSPKLLQGDNGLVHDNGGITFGYFDEAHEEWVN
ncbi:hypothetical protein SSX86_009036 [Deinandra increscens subsp. villosa]|uniref:NAC domain-containing protein n=1 Tax=Deinandra increscens subsp. villosa TaxID=3103831 RepID=A0AAP0H579_9ASTR